MPTASDVEMLFRARAGGGGDAVGGDAGHFFLFLTVDVVHSLGRCFGAEWRLSGLGMEPEPRRSRLNIQGELTWSRFGHNHVKN